MSNSMSVTLPSIGWIGTGVMGTSMCGHLIHAGYSVRVFNRTESKLRSLVDQGAIAANSPAEVARQADFVFSIVGYPDDVRQIYFGQHGILSAAQPGSVLIDMTTSQPSLAREIDQAARALDIMSLDAPVSGGDIGAKEARLSIMVGGEKPAFERSLPLLQKMGKTIVYQGKAGSGQHTKMVNQTLIASNMVGLCEAMLYAYRAGLDLPTVLQSVSPGAAGSWSLTNLGPRILQGDFRPGFFVDHIVKDMGIVLEESRRMKLALPGLALAQQLYVALQAQGGGKLGTQALIKAISQLSQVDWPKSNESYQA